MSQNVHLFNDTAANNIAYAAADDFSREQIEQAACVANADGFIRQMPAGYDTVIGENGSTFSVVSVSVWRLRGPCCGMRLSCWMRRLQPWILNQSAIFKAR